MIFILALTVGLLVYLAIGTWLDANEFALELPAFWQGVPLVIFIALLTLGVLLAVGSVRKGQETTLLGIAYRIAMGIGLHNLGEGLAIGAAFALGEAALGTFLILGFTLHNITEGVGIVAPVVRKNPGLSHFLLLALIAGGPAILGTWIGGFAFDAVLATIFLAIGVFPRYRSRRDTAGGLGSRQAGSAGQRQSRAPVRQLGQSRRRGRRHRADVLHRFFCEILTCEG